jgi:hypothetical protein
MSQTELEVSKPEALYRVERGGLDMPALFSAAVAMGEAGVGVLERLLVIKREVDADNARSAFYDAFARFQKACPEVSKNRDTRKVTGPGAKFGFTYATYEHIMEVVREPLAAEGLFVSFDTSTDGAKITTICWLHHTGGHKEKSEVTLPTDSTLQIGSQQKVGAARQYGKRYALIDRLGLTITDEELAPGEELTMETIDEGQVAVLKSLIAEVKADLARFLAVYGISGVEQLSKAQYRAACGLLESKRKKS